MDQSNSNGRILNIPSYLNQVRPSTDYEESDGASEVMETESVGGEQGDEGIGEFDDGKTGKLTLAILLQEELIHAGEKVLSIDYLGQTFKGDLLPIGKIRSVETSLVFNNPSAWAIYCKKIINPAKKSGCGWASVKYKGRKMDYFKNVWQKRKAQREAETAKNEAAQALTALSTSVSPGALMPGSVDQIPQGHQLQHQGHQLVKASSLTHHFSASKNHFVELENFSSEGKLQPFTVSVSTSAMLVLDLHSHTDLDSEVCGYLGGHWDPNSHNLAITNTFPCLITDRRHTETAQKVETEIYEALYGSHLSLVGWYHSNPKGPAAPHAKDCFDQLDFQIKLLGHSDASYTPCVGIICAPYQEGAKSSESSIVIYWIYPPSETSSNPEMGRPMRMSYSAITDPCLSEGVIQQVDKVISFSKQKSDKVPFLDKFNQDQTYIDKIGRSLVSKFPQDQDDKLWHYIRSQLVEGLEQREVNGDNRKHSEEEAEIDDDEDTALKEELQEEIDDDEESAIVVRSQGGCDQRSGLITISQYSPLTSGTQMSFTRDQEGGQDTVNISIPETQGQVVLPPGFDSDDQPLSLTTSNGREDVPLNFSTSRQEDDSDGEDRLVIRE